MIVTLESYRTRSGGALLILILATGTATPFGEVPIEESDERALLGRVCLAPVEGCAAGSGQGDGVTLIDVTRHDDRMHVGLATDCWRVVEQR